MTKILVISALGQFLGTARGRDRGDPLSGGAFRGRLRRIELLKRFPMKQLLPGVNSRPGRVRGIS